MSWFRDWIFSSPYYWKEYDWPWGDHFTGSSKCRLILPTLVGYILNYMCFPSLIIPESIVAGNLFYGAFIDSRHSRSQEILSVIFTRYLHLGGHQSLVSTVLQQVIYLRVVNHVLRWQITTPIFLVVWEKLPDMGHLNEPLVLVSVRLHCHLCTLSVAFRSCERPAFVDHILLGVQHLNWITAQTKSWAFNYLRSS